MCLVIFFTSRSIMSKKISFSKNNLRCASLPCRPPTRRHPFETPNNIKIRSVSAIVTSRKDVNTPLYYALNTMYKDMENNGQPVMRGRFLKEIAQFKKLVKSSSNGDSQYSKFILNAVNEIIKKRIIAIDRIYLTFLKHMEENRDQLELRKMIDELKQFCLSVRIPFNENLYMLSVNAVEKQGGDIHSTIIQSSDKDSLSRLTERTEPVSAEGDYHNESTYSERSIELSCPNSSSSTETDSEILPVSESLEMDNASVQVSKHKWESLDGTIKFTNTISTQTEKNYFKSTPIIKINLKNLSLKDEDYLLLECPVYLPRLILEKSLQEKNICNINDVRIDASVSKVGVKKTTLFKK